MVYASIDCLNALIVKDRGGYCLYSWCFNQRWEKLRRWKLETETKVMFEQWVLWKNLEVNNFFYCNFLIFLISKLLKKKILIYIDVLIYKDKNIISHFRCTMGQGNLLLPCPKNLHRIKSLPHVLPHGANFLIISIPLRDKIYGASPILEFFKVSFIQLKK